MWQAKRLWLSFIVGLAIACALPARLLAGPTLVIDFKTSAQGTTTDIFGNDVGAFDVTSYGFAAGLFSTITDAIFAELQNDYFNIPTVGQNALSPIPDGMQLDLEIIEGDIGSAPSNGASEWYFVQVGSFEAGPHGSALGVAGGDTVRDSSGTVNPFALAMGSVVASIFTDNINVIGGIGTALTSGDLFATTQAVEGTIAHEVGHTLSLDHVFKAGSVTDSGVSPLLGTGALDLPNGDRIIDREFSFSGTAADGTTTLNNITQLFNALGDAPSAAPEPTWLGVLAVMALCLHTTGRRRMREDAAGAFTDK